MSKKKNPNLKPVTPAVRRQKLLEKVSNAKVSNEIKREAAFMIQNGISEAVMGFEPGGIGVQLSQADTLFKNNRWYLVSNMRQLLSETYVENGLIQTIIDVPVDDGLRGGVEIKSKQLDEDQLAELQVEIERNNDLGIMGQALKWNRLFGGAGVIIMTGGDPSTPLNPNELKPGKPFEFRDVDMWELFWAKQNTSDYAAAIDTNQLNDVEYYDYYGIKLHHTRVIKLVGIRAPSFVRPRLRGWGVSKIETLIRSINQYMKSQNLVFEVLDEFKVDYFKFANLANTLMSPQGEEQVRKRVGFTNRTKNYLNSVIMDKEDDFGSKELSFAGISETQAGIRMQVACDMRMPITKIFGVSSAGFSSGEDDIENYNAMVESEVRTKAKYSILEMIAVRCQILFGFIPDDLSLNYKPLRVLSAEAEENVKTQKFNRLLQARQVGEMSSKEFKEACNKDNLLSVKLDPSRETLEVEGQTTDQAATGKNITGDRAPKSTLRPSEDPKAKNEADGGVPRICVVGITCGDYVLTGRRKDNNLWTFPGGHAEVHEPAEIGACREALEEAGIALTPSDLNKLPARTFTSHRKAGKKFEVHPFVAEIPERVMPMMGDDPDQEFSVLRWVRIHPSSQELMPENRHAKEDLVLDYLLKNVKAES